MAKVSLRIYNRDIENLIDQGHLDEAIAHCRHILKTFPKHLETYRLLGKAYLEAKRYDEAVDIFQRVLVAVPDDFVSHVGMSIIRDDQGKLDDAIWHMERAFESQPANAAIQGELRRLYGRRDGVEPPKIRMTRGALAHMYVQGELYPQAISEIRAVLAQDSQRVDMKVLLALAYFRSGQKADASEICNQLLIKPGGENCFEANRVMMELLQGSDNPENIESYRQCVNQLDPYAAFAQGSVFLSSTVSDAAVTLERLEYSGQSAEMERDWRPSGIGLTSSAQQPEWLSAAAPQQEQKPASPAPFEEVAGPTPVSTGQEEIPDFLRQAGWRESSGTVEESAPPFEIEQTPPVSEADLAPGEMPDWLKAMTPSQPEPMASPEPSAPEPSASEPVSEQPDWLKGLTGAAAASTTEAPIAPDDTPTWLSGSGETPAETAIPAEEGALPDWISPEKNTRSSVPVPEPSASLETLGASAQEQDDAVAWLESLAAKHGAKPEELVTDPNARSETPPEWVEQARVIAESQPPVATPVTPEPAKPASEDETGVWLRDLAAKETSNETMDEGVEKVQPYSEMETPDWLKDLQPASAIEESPQAQETTPVPLEDEQIPGWLKGFESELKLDEEPFPISTSEPLPLASVDYGETVKLDINTASEQELGDLPGIGLLLAQAIVAHRERYGNFTNLEDLLNIPGIGPVLVEELASRLEVRPVERMEGDVVASQEDLPAWLRGLDEEPPQVQPTTPMDWQPVVPESEPQTEVVQAAPPPPKASAPTKPVSDQSAAPRPAARPRQVEKATPAADTALEEAQGELSRGDIPAALEHYGKLIKRGRFTEEIIHDLRDALYRYPVEVTVWQALGDAYMRANRLQEALDAYTKAEELLR